MRRNNRNTLTSSSDIDAGHFGQPHQVNQSNRTLSNPMHQFSAPKDHRNSAKKFQFNTSEPPIPLKGRFSLQPQT